MTKKEFLQEVIQEAKNIKKHATKEEIERLDFKALRPNSPSRCIYGQMIGHCRDTRARELINKCTLRVWKTDDGVGDIEDQSFTRVKNRINGTVAKGAKVKGNYTYLSLIEGYITLKGAKNKELIEFIKGEIEEPSL